MVSALDTPTVTVRAFRCNYLRVRFARPMPLRQQYGSGRDWQGTRLLHIVIRLRFLCLTVPGPHLTIPPSRVWRSENRALWLPPALDRRRSTRCLCAGALRLLSCAGAARFFAQRRGFRRDEVRSMAPSISPLSHTCSSHSLRIAHICSLLLPIDAPCPNNR
ncbi:hypothetical protein BD309DRAFT_697239 [Dichomitus squalens]|uniref:Uncharacterized protein n=1 Tax=Dichomitus squalens TaxID=114155 RepID=A0A4Q9NVD5_9APHY|nr:hypothetical protein BD309DRAFT_697239 [Dichomitus squalens]TBU62762.1 hypothetical protein BD310DRAFT_701905 [Dichomitus squalens]